MENKSRWIVHKSPEPFDDTYTCLNCGMPSYDKSRYCSFCGKEMENGMYGWPSKGENSNE